MVEEELFGVEECPDDVLVGTLAVGGFLVAVLVLDDALEVRPCQHHLTAAGLARESRQKQASNSLFLRAGSIGLRLCQRFLCCFSLGLCGFLLLLDKLGQLLFKIISIRGGFGLVDLGVHGNQRLVGSGMLGLGLGQRFVSRHLFTGQLRRATTAAGELTLDVLRVQQV